MHSHPLGMIKMDLKGIDEAMEMVRKVAGLEGEHVEIFYDPETKELYSYEVEDGHWIQPDNALYSVSGTSKKEILDNIVAIDKYYTTYQSKMSAEEFFWQ